MVASNFFLLGNVPKTRIVNVLSRVSIGTAGI